MVYPNTDYTIRTKAVCKDSLISLTDTSVPSSSFTGRGVEISSSAGTDAAAGFSCLCSFCL